MSSEEEKNKVLARRLVEAFASGDLDTLDEMLAPDFVDRSLLPGQGSSREEYKRSAAEFRAAFSIADFTIEDQIVQGDKVVTKFSLMSIHRGEFLGVPPSGEVGEYSSIRIHRIVGGKITDEWSEGNLLGVMLPSFERLLPTVLPTVPAPVAIPGTTALAMTVALASVSCPALVPAVPARLVGATSVSSAHRFLLLKLLVLHDGVSCTRSGAGVTSGCSLNTLDRAVSGSPTRGRKIESIRKKWRCR